MAQKSNTTKKYQIWAFVMGLLSFLCLVAPIAIFGIKAFIVAESVEKLLIGGLATAAIIMTLMNLLMKMKMRSPVWLCLIGIYIALDNIMPLIIVISIATLLDEVVFTPLCKNFKQKAIINTQIDQRM